MCKHIFAKSLRLDESLDIFSTVFSNVCPFRQIDPISIMSQIPRTLQISRNLHNFMFSKSILQFQQTSHFFFFPRFHQFRELLQFYKFSNFQNFKSFPVWRIFRISTTSRKSADFFHFKISNDTLSTISDYHQRDEGQPPPQREFVILMFSLRWWCPLISKTMNSIGSYKSSPLRSPLGGMSTLPWVAGFPLSTFALGGGVFSLLPWSLAWRFALFPGWWCPLTSFSWIRKM